MTSAVRVGRKEYIARCTSCGLEETALDASRFYALYGLEKKGWHFWTNEYKALCPSCHEKYKPKAKRYPCINGGFIVDYSPVYRGLKP